MKEYFKITSGNLYHDQATEELVLYYNRQQIYYGLMLAGAIMLIYSIL
jgi:hypothetical protein